MTKVDVETKAIKDKVPPVEKVDLKTEVTPHYRMYVFVLKQLSPMQKGIQAAHSIVEYGLRHALNTDYIMWGNDDKTIVVLDGGIYNDMNDIIHALKENVFTFSVFREPDLNNMVTAISLIVPEEVYDLKKYPDFEVWEQKKYPLTPKTFFLEGLSLFQADAENKTENKHYSEWLKNIIGSQKNANLRNIIKSKHLAR